MHFCAQFVSGCEWFRAVIGRKTADDLTLQQFPYTPAGHRKLLSRANYYKRSMKRAWSSFFEEVRDSRQRWAEMQTAMRDLESVGTQHQISLDTTLKKFQQLMQELGRTCECPVCYTTLHAAETNPEHKQFMNISSVDTCCVETARAR